MFVFMFVLILLVVCLFLYVSFVSHRSVLSSSLLFLLSFLCLLVIFVCVARQFLSTILFLCYIGVLFPFLLLCPFQGVFLF